MWICVVVINYNVWKINTHPNLMKEDTPKTLVEHILELRTVLLNSVLYVFGGMVFAVLCSQQIFDFLMMPLRKIMKQGSGIVYTSITEPIATELKVAFYTSILLSFPFIVRELWKFVRPGLKPIEISIVKKYCWLSVVLFLSGAVFAYYCVVPNVIEAIFHWSLSSMATFLPKMSENISFVLVLIMAFGFSFQIPIVMLVLDKLQVISFVQQKKVWREYIICIMIISAIITPPDVLSMLLLAFPLIFWYGMTLIIVFLRPNII